MTAKALTVHNAEITTAAVSIKTLTITGKQVTLATFRQLREEPLIADDGSFRGLPWGAVNYHPDKSCDGYFEHEHVIWQLGDELRRATAVLPNPRIPYASPAVDDVVLLEGVSEKSPTVAWYGWAPTEWMRVTGSTYHDAGLVEFRFGGLPCRAPRPCRAGYGVDAETVEAIDRDAAYAELRVEVKAEKERRERHIDRWVEIKALPQLFIAT